MVRTVFGLVMIGLAGMLAERGGVAADRERLSYVAHEWGTFSTFSGSDGKALKFYPNDTDLPDFVHNRYRDVKGGLTDSLVSLETPVLYFYNDRDRTVSVHVEFPKGIMTDWYPEASRPPTQQLRWDDLKVMATERPRLPEEKGKGRYFAARDVDAAQVRTSSEAKSETEKFLFYRGVGDFRMPFEVKALGRGQFAVTNTGQQAIPGHFLVNIEDGKLRFKSLGELKPDAEEKVSLPAETGTVEALSEAMVKLLTAQGLFEAEAKAMVKTWQADWFKEPGTRVLYLVAEPVVKELLPMTIEPSPDKVVRVLVGRHDVLTPEREAVIDGLVAKLNGASNAEAKAADAELGKLGRFRAAAQTAAEKRLMAAGAGRRR